MSKIEKLAFEVVCTIFGLPAMLRVGAQGRLEVDCDLNANEAVEILRVAMASPIALIAMGVAPMGVAGTAPARAPSVVSSGAIGRTVGTSEPTPAPAEAPAAHVSKPLQSETLNAHGFAFEVVKGLSAVDLAAAINHQAIVHNIPVVASVVNGGVQLAKVDAPAATPAPAPAPAAAPVAAAAPPPAKRTRRKTEAVPSDAPAQQAIAVAPAPKVPLSAIKPAESLAPIAPANGHSVTSADPWDLAGKAAAPQATPVTVSQAALAAVAVVKPAQVASAAPPVSNGDLPIDFVLLGSAERLKEVLVHLNDLGVKHFDVMVATCKEIAPRIAFMNKMPDMEGRIARASASLGLDLIGAPAVDG